MEVHSRDLRYFVAVAEELHFTRAAECLFISQPALSKQIRALERALGAPLFERSGREVRLTTVGEALLPQARMVLKEWETAEEAVEQAKEAQQATLVIGMNTSPGRGGLLPAIRSRFSLKHPAASLMLRQVNWEDATAGLADGSSDVAFVWLPLSSPGRYGWIVVAEEPSMVAMPERHRFVRGMVSWIGFRQCPLAYERQARFAGHSKYPFMKMVRFAFDAITGFSIKPLKIAIYLGAVTGAMALVCVAYVIWSWTQGATVAGWPSLMFVVLLLGSVQLFVLGIIGEYLGQIFVESKRRPLFIIDEICRSGESLEAAAGISPEKSLAENPAAETGGR